MYKRQLIDCGPDFRAQVLHLPFEKIDGVLITHEHYDHVSGLDDLSPFCRFGAVPIYAEEYVARALRLRMPYCFVDHRYPCLLYTSCYPQSLHRACQIQPFPQILDLCYRDIRRIFHIAVPQLSHQLRIR